MADARPACTCGAEPIYHATPVARGGGTWHRIWCPRCGCGGGGESKEEAEKKWRALLARAKAA